MIQNNVPILID